MVKRVCTRVHAAHHTAADSRLIRTAMSVDRPKGSSVTKTRFPASSKPPPR